MFKMMGLVVKIRTWLNILKFKVKFYSRLSELGEVARRYFVMNAFDGVLAILGLIAGAHISGNANPRVVLGSGLGLSLAMSISGFSGAYIAEKAERNRQLREIEKALFIDVNGTVLDKAMNLSVVLVALINATAPLVTSMLALAPYVLAMSNIITLMEAFTLSLLVISLMLFTLGYFLGRVIGKTPLRYGLIILVIGLAVGFLVMILTW
jgi:predicted membrane protein (TIGR00267 family)